MSSSDTTVPWYKQVLDSRGLSAHEIFVLAPTVVGNNRLLRKSTNPRINTILRLYSRDLVPA